MGRLSPAERAAADVHGDAKQLLRSFGITVTEIVRVEPDSILFLGACRQPRTAWLRVHNERVCDIPHEAGLLAEPPAWVIRRLHPDE